MANSSSTTMAATPKRSVHWNYDEMSFSELNSPGSAGSESFVSTSSLEYVNAQLLAHGYVDKTGLCLDGASSKDSESVVKCLLKLLGDRMVDMSRTEELTTKLRTMTYENERLASMHRSAVEKAANAEREANLHKSKLTAAQRSLQSSETAHKQTTAELQRTRTSLQAIRSAHQAELKKREKEVERLTEKWQKIADLQTRVSNQPSGISCANLAPVEGRRLDMTPTFQDVALDEAERAREALLEDNQYLKALFLKAVNSIQRILYQTKCLLTDSTTEQEPTSFTVATLFPINPPTHPADTLSSILTGLRSSLETVSERLVNPVPATSTEAKEAQQARAMNGEIRRLQTIIENLEDELDRCHRQLEGQAQEIQTMCEQFAEQQQTSAKELGDMSMDLIDVDGRDEEKEKLERIREELDREQQKFTDAAMKFKNEKAALEVERSRFLDEKRSWEMDKVLANLGNAPPEERPVSPVRPLKAHKPSPRKPSFKSPKKLLPKKAPSRMKSARDSRKTLGSPKRVIPAAETEVLPPLPTLTFSTLGDLPPGTSLLSTAFVLPPPSPLASLPSNPALPVPKPISAPDFGVANIDDKLQAPPEFAEPPPASNDEGEPATPPPARKAFPVAKPFAQRMVHAYSPVKPSPLSRILSLTDSPPTGIPPIAAPKLGTVSEETLSPDAFLPSQPAMTLAQELGITESPPESPLQEKKSVPNVVPGKSTGPTTTKGRVLFPDPNAKKPSARPSAAATTTMTAREKGKMRADAASAAKSGAKPTKPVGSSRTVRTAIGSGEKENSDGTGVLKVGRSGKVSPVFKPPPPVTTTTTATKKGPSPTSSAAVPGSSNPAASKPPSASAKPIRPPSSRASMAGGRSTGPGPRRVPIDSEEAPAVAKTRRV